MSPLDGRRRTDAQMKKVEAIVNQHAFQEVRELLLAQGHEIVVSEVLSANGAGGRSLHYRGVEYRADETRLKIETVVPDADAMRVAHSILSVSHRVGSTEDAVSISHLENVLSIGITNLETQPRAVSQSVPARTQPQPVRFSRHVLAI